MTVLETAILVTLLAVVVLAACAWLAFQLWPNVWHDDQPDVGLSIFDPHPDVHIARSPLLSRIAQAERAGEFVEALAAAHQRIEARTGPGRHRAEGLRDPHRGALMCDTRPMLLDELAAA